MSISKRIAFGAAATWFGRGVNIVLGLVLLPVLFRNLPQEELGVWLLLGQTWAAMGILDLGFGVTLTRRIALAKGKSGADPSGALTPETQAEIADLVACGRRICRIMAGGAFLVSWVLGLVYLNRIELHGVSRETAWLAWTVLCAAQAMTVWATVWTCLLQGVGYVGWDAIITSVVQAVMLVAQIVAALCGGGLVALATIAAIGALFQRGLVRWFARKNRPELFALRGRWNPAVLRGMPALAFRAWLTAVGAILVFNSDQFFIASTHGAVGIPAYRSAFVLVHNLTILASTLGLASSVFISHLWQAGNLVEVHRIVERNCRLGLLIMLCSSAVLAVAGHDLFNVWLGEGNFVGYAILGLFLASETLETQGVVISSNSRATEDEAFALSSLLGGVLKIALGFLFLRWWGLAGLAASTLVALLVTNHSYMVVRGLHRLKLPFGGYARTVLLPVTLWSIATWVAASLVYLVARDTAPWVRVALASAGGGVLFLSALWYSVLSAHEKSRLLAKASTLMGRTPVT